MVLQVKIDYINRLIDESLSEGEKENILTDLGDD